ncbi:MAG TPA: Gfo/Idh/MocA family oxidoreductase [Microvirga sp.]|jgi:predicted dehydrogenase|nr:Gfo/Idh/MocA family oxidoreductase [Microvirga sp.]
MARFAIVGLDHRHVYHLAGGLIEAGATCAGYDPQTSDPRVLEGFQSRFPDLTPVPREALLDDPSIDVICSAAVPDERAGLAIEAMRRGKHVMVDKPGITTLEQWEAVRAAVRETGRIFSICFSERFVVPAMEVATRLVRDGAVGQVIQTVGLGPHRLNQAIRPGWFFDARRYGGILVDIASHQIDQFLVLTGSSHAEITMSAVGHFGRTTRPDFQDFGEIALRSESASGYIRVDWFTPDGLPTWGDGRLFVLGTEGTIEVRKYLDVAGRTGPDHLFLTDRTGVHYIDCSSEKLTYFRNFLADVRDGSQTAMPQEHVFTVSRLAIEAQARASWVGGPRP